MPFHSKCAGSLAAVAALVITSGASAQPEGPPPAWMCRQRVEVRFASAEAAAAAKVSFAPVLGDREWAFSARWDDNSANSLVMRDVMARNGLRGTFYLNRTDPKGTFGAEYCAKLMQDGFSIGGHTQTHPKLADVTAGDAFKEILQNRIEREAQTDCPINSFAFPNGQFKADSNPDLWEITSRALNRAGYSHCVYIGFVNGNPFVAPGAFSTVLQVVPGDREVDAAKFRESLAKVLQNRETYQKSSHCISLGVHAWQQGDEWGKLEELFRELSGKEDWWYCSLTQYAAYERQVRGSQVEALPPGDDAAVRCYELSRPSPGDIGAALPLTCVFEGGEVVAVTVDGAALDVRKGEGRASVNVPPSAERPLPGRIGVIEMPATAALGELPTCSDFPQVRMGLRVDPDAARIAWQCSPDVGLRDLRIRFRLPVKYTEGILTGEVARVAAGETADVETALPPVREGDVWAAGPQYYVAEVDFMAPDGPGRVFVTVTK